MSGFLSYLAYLSFSGAIVTTVLAAFVADRPDWTRVGFKTGLWLGITGTLLFQAVLSVVLVFGMGLD